MPLSGPKLVGPAPLHDLTLSAASDAPDAVALISEEDTWTYRQLDQDVKSLAGNLIELGLAPGDRVASLMPNCGQLLIFFLACLKAGLVIVPINYRYTPSGIDYALKAAGAKLLLAHAERQKDVEASELAGTLPLGTVYFGGEPAGTRNFDDLIAEGASRREFPNVDLNALAFIFFTSGSTGKPKGVMHSISSFGSITASWAQAMGLSDADIVFPGGSISHVGGLSTALAALSKNARVILSKRFDADTVLPLLKAKKPTILVALPAALVMLQHDLKASRSDFASMRLCITGGDKFPLDLEKEFVALTGLEIKETYGLTEAADCLFAPPEGKTKHGSVGVLGPGFEGSIRDEHGNEVPRDKEGIFWLRGSPLFMRYLNDPEATRSAFDDGWFDTGDVMRCDADGYFWFRGRKKQIIVHDGSNIAPQEVEEAVMLHPAVDLAGAIGVHDTVHGENVWAFVSLKKGAAKPAVSDIIALARREIGYKAPEVILFLEEMPLNASGKVDRLALKKLAAERVSG